MNAACSRRAFVGAAAVLVAGASSRRLSAQTQIGSVLHIGNSRVESQAQAMYADELGLLRQAGLNVDITLFRGGAATVAAAAGGALQIGCANVISLAQAIQRKLPFVMLVPAAIWDSKRPTDFLVVTPESPIKTAKDLNGKILGVASLNGMDQLFMESFIRKGGGDPSSVKFVEIPDSVATEALVQGRIAAFLLAEPVFSDVGSRVRSIGPAPDAVAPYFAQTVWFTTADWLAQNKDIARTFVNAIIAAGKWAMANPTAAAGVMQKRLGFKEVRSVASFATSTDPILVQVVLDVAAEYKMLPAMRAADYFWSGK